jgi:dTMP kinase
MFVTLDGIDGTGKSTQVARLADWLRRRGKTVTVCSDPGGTELGGKLREILLHARLTQIGMRTEALLFMASRAELVLQVIRPALARGEVVVSDRYLLANVVYQGHAGGLQVDDLWQVGEFSTGGLVPDLTIVLDLPVEVAEDRRGRSADRMEARGREFAERVRAGFLTEAKRQPDQITVIDATPDSDTVYAAILAVVEAHMRRPVD